MRKHHDTGYKKLYSFPKMVEDLLVGFVGHDWVNELDFATLEKLNNSYVTDEFRERSDDIIWRVRFRKRWLYVYLLIEFQSAVDHTMPVRLLSYIGALYQDLITSKKIRNPKKLPPVMPIVLYNGEPRWNAALTLEEMIEPIPESLAQYQPQLRYWLIDEGRFSAAELETQENLTAAIIRAELAEDHQQFARVAANLNIWLKRPEQQDLRRVIKEWLIQMLQRQLPDIKVDEVQSLTEIETMLARDWSEKWKDQGKAEGEQIGIAKGRVEGEGLLLRKLLVKRWGALPDWAEQKLTHASTEQLETWAEKILDADNLEAVFE